MKLIFIVLIVAGILCVIFSESVGMAIFGVIMGIVVIGFIASLGKANRWHVRQKELEDKERAERAERNAEKEKRQEENVIHARRERLQKRLRREPTASEMALEEKREEEREYHEDARQQAREETRRPGRCARCGRTRREVGRIERHHPDYSSPLEVIGLCRYCHHIVHSPKYLQAPDFRGSIEPSSVSRKGKRKFRIAVRRLTDGAEKTSTVHGGWLLAERECQHLAEELGCTEGLRLWTKRYWPAV